MRAYWDDITQAEQATRECHKILWELRTRPGVDLYLIDSYQIIMDRLRSSGVIKIEMPTQLAYESADEHYLVACLRLKKKSYPVPFLFVLLGREQESTSPLKLSLIVYFGDKAVQDDYNQNPLLYLHSMAIFPGLPIESSFGPRELYDRLPYIGKFVRCTLRYSELIREDRKLNGYRQQRRVVDRWPYDPSDAIVFGYVPIKEIKVPEDGWHITIRLEDLGQGEQEYSVVPVESKITFWPFLRPNTVLAYARMCDILTQVSNKPVVVAKAAKVFFPQEQASDLHLVSNPEGNGPLLQKAEITGNYRWELLSLSEKKNTRRYREEK